MTNIDKKVLDPIELSDKVVVSDPCYKRDVWCMGFLDNVLPGNYIPTIKYSDEDDWGVRVKMVMVERIGSKKVGKWEKQKFTVGVDSGQGGIFCDTIYPLGETGEYGDKNSFYGVCCDAFNGPEQYEYEKWWSKKSDKEQAKRLLEVPGFENNPYWLAKSEIELPEEPFVTQAGNVFGKGVVTRSGYGDGSYDCLVRRSEDGKIIGIKIIYI